jgi:hypothetical protein
MEKWEIYFLSLSLLRSCCSGRAHLNGPTTSKSTHEAASRPSANPPKVDLARRVSPCRDRPIGADIGHLG